MLEEQRQAGAPEITFEMEAVGVSALENCYDASGLALLGPRQIVAEVYSAMRASALSCASIPAKVDQRHRSFQG